MMKALQIQVESLTRQVDTLGPENERVRKLLTEFDQRHDADQARLRELEDEFAALREASGVRVKPLEWVSDTPDGTGFWANGEFAYQIRPGGLGYYRWRRALSCTWVIPDQIGVETAKAAAQADYERRILAALEPAPVTVGKNDILRMIIAKLEQCESDVAPWALKWCDKLASALLEGATLEIVIEDLRALADAGEAG